MPVPDQIPAGAASALPAAPVSRWRKRAELVALALVWLALGTVAATFFGMVYFQTGSE